MFAAVAALVVLHWIISTAAFYSERFGRLVENTPRKLIIDGVVQENALRKSKIGENDLEQAIREEANMDAFDKVEIAYLERDGRITVIPKKRQLKPIEVKIEEGIQTIRIVIEN